MANSKISALTSATTPLAGTETLPVVQSSATKKVTVANLTAGRDVATNSVAVAAGVPVYLNGTSGNTQILYYASLVIDAQVNGTKGWRLYAPGAGTSEMRGDWAVNNTGGGSGNLTMSNGNVVQGTAAKGINFTANTPAAGMTSQLLNWYEEGTWTPVVTSGTGTITSYTAAGRYTRIGRQVTLTWYISVSNNGTGAGYINITGAPFSSGVGNTALFGFNQSNGAACTGAINGTTLEMYKYDATYPIATGQTINGSITYSV
jgi:hypothetical protein